MRDSFADSLRELIGHSKLATSRRSTPSDFHLARIDEPGLERLAQVHPGFEDVYPLSPMQRLFYSVHEMGAAVGVEEWRFELRGALDPGDLRRAWEHLLERHTMLRTAFTTAASAEPLQVVLGHAELPWQEEDLRGSSADEQEKRIREIVERERARGFDLAQAPLLRLHLVRLGEDRRDLLWTTHHLYIDGWSWPIVFKELGMIYAALRTGSAPSLPDACPYGRYIRWLSDRTENSEAFWKAELGGFTESTPLDLGLPAAGDKGPGEEVLELTTAQSGRVQSLAREQHVTLSSVVQATWALLLSHYSDRSDVVFGAAFSGRPPELPGIDELIGPCVNNVPVRAAISKDEPVAALAMQLQLRQPELSQHQYDPLAQIQGWAGVPLSKRLFDSLVVFQNYIVDESRSAARRRRTDQPAGRSRRDELSDHARGRPRLDPSFQAPLPE